MSWISRLLVRLLANGAALYVAQYFVEGFSVEPNLEAYIEIAAVLTLVNLLIRPIIKLILTPIIIVTLGLGIVVINALLLYGVDWFMPELTISGLFPLVYATLIIGIVNYIVSLSRKKSEHAS